MAGRFLLIEFDDEESANTLRARIDQATRNGKRYRVIGLFSRPGPTFCSCGDDLPYSVHEFERGRKYIPSRVGKKFGWRVCLECRKPLRDMGFLYNQIAPDDIIDPVTHEGTPYKGRRHNLQFYFTAIGAATRVVTKKKER